MSEFLTVVFNYDVSCVRWNVGCLGLIVGSNVYSFSYIMIRGRWKNVIISLVESKEPPH